MITKEQIESNFKALSQYVLKQGASSLYLSGSDYYLSEYTAKEDSLKTYLTPFTGSTAEVLFVPDKKIYLFVDGRYHLQADIECQGYNFIEVVKVSSQASLFQSLLSKVTDSKLEKIACIGERTSLATYEKFKSLNFTVLAIESLTVEKMIGYNYNPIPSPIHVVPANILPASIDDKFKQLNIPDHQGIYLSSCDDIAWLSHCRSYQCQGNSYFFSKALVLKNHVHIFIPKTSELSPEAKNLKSVTFYHMELDKLETNIKNIVNAANLTSIIFDPTTVTMKDYLTLNSIFKESNLKRQMNPVTKFKMIKTALELKEYERSFLLSSQAIAETIRYAKSMVAKKSHYSEKDLANTIWEQYQKRGSRSLSFNTISAVGENSAIIHYGSCSDKKLLQAGQMVLLDSGAYYESGFATDCTRCFVPEFNTLSAEKKKTWKKFYTLVLKAQLQAEMSVFRAGTLGNAIDQVARGVLLAQGLDFQHGLGHGVGIRVHDPGAGRLSAFSREELQAGVVCSIEPGYYVNGEFGIRLENVVYVAPHENYPDLLKFKPLIRVAWEEELIDWEQLSIEESKYLKEYQADCQKLGTHT